MTDRKQADGNDACSCGSESFAGMECVCGAKQASAALIPAQVDALLDDIYDALGSIEIGYDYKKAAAAVQKLREAFGGDRG